MPGGDNGVKEDLVEVLASLQYVSTELEEKLPNFTSNLESKIELLAKTDTLIEALHSSVTEKIDLLKETGRGTLLPEEVYGELTSLMRMIKDRDEKRRSESVQQKSPAPKSGPKILEEIKSMRKELLEMKARSEELSTQKINTPDPVNKAPRKISTIIIRLSIAVGIFGCGVAVGIFLVN